MDGTFTFADLTEERIFINVEKSEWSYGRTAKCCLLYSGHAVPTAVTYSAQQFSQHVMWSLQYTDTKNSQRMLLYDEGRVQDVTWQSSLNHELTAMLLKGCTSLSTEGMRVVGIELGCLFKSLKIIYRRVVKKKLAYVLNQPWWRAHVTSFVTKDCVRCHY